MRTFDIGLTLLVMSCCPCNAMCDLDQMVGYTLIAKKIIAGSITDEKKEDEFSGCDFDRILIFDDNTAVRCTNYSYHYAYRPTAWIFVKSSSIKLCIDNSWFDAAPLR